MLFVSSSPWQRRPHLAAASAPVKLTVQAGRRAASIQLSVQGVFFEDISFGADGSLYAELVAGVRSFEFPDPAHGLD